MIYDCFTFFNELDILEMRLNILDEIVDKFVLVESRKTHTNLDKPLYFEENKKRFEKFEDKIIHIIADDLPPFQVTWTNEVCQRNAIEKGLVDCQDDDVIIISDLDEIPNPQKVLEVKDLPGIKALDLTFSTFYLNCIHAEFGEWKKGPKILSYKDFKTYFDDKNYNYSIYCPEKYNKGNTATKVRLYDYAQHFEDAGWHFHSIGGASSLFQKFRSRAHIKRTKDLNDEELEAELQRQIDNVVSGKTFLIAPIGTNLPQYILENQQKYSHLLYEPTLKMVFEYKYYAAKKKLKSMAGNFIAKYIFSRKKDFDHYYLTFFGFKAKLERVSAKKKQKCLQKNFDEISRNLFYQNQSDDFWAYFMSEDFETNFASLTKDFDSESKKRIKTSMALMLSNHVRKNNIFSNDEDRMEFDILKEYSLHHHSTKDGEFNFKGYKFVDSDYQPCRFLYELGLVSVKNLDKSKNFLEIGASSGDSSFILSSKTAKDLFVYNPSQKLKSNVELNQIKNIKYVETLGGFEDLGLIRLDLSNVEFDDEVLSLINKYKPVLLIEFNENLRDLQKIKEKINSLNAGYHLRLTKGNPQNPSGETILVGEIF